MEFSVAAALQTSGIEMKKSYIELVFAIVATTFGFAPVRANTIAPIPISTWRELSHGVWLVPEEVRSDREPDGNSIIFGVSSGLVVFDTGRHEWHRNAIIALADTQKKPIVAIFNSHWHLDPRQRQSGLARPVSGFAGLCQRRHQWGADGFSCG